MRKLTFYFDYISPNAYLAWSQLSGLVERYELELEIVPVLFAGLLEAHKQMGPAEQPAKRDWMAKNIARKAAILNLPLAKPKFHPFNPLLALRLSNYPLAHSEQTLLVDRIMKGIWVDSLHPSEESDVRLMLEDTGLNVDAMLDYAASSGAAEQLREQTLTAIEAGVFGIPSMLCEGELFFGYDDFEFLAMMLEGRDPAKASERARQWLATPPTPSATRSAEKYSGSE